MPAHLVGNDPEQMQGIEVPRIGLEDLPVELLRLLQFAGAVLLHSQVQHAGNIDHGEAHKQLADAERNPLGSSFPYGRTSETLVLRTLLVVADSSLDEIENGTGDGV